MPKKATTIKKTAGPVKVAAPKRLAGLMELFEAFDAKPTAQLEKQINQAILETEWHIAMTGKGLENLPEGERVRVEQVGEFEVLAMPVDDDVLALPFFESGDDLDDWYDSVKDDPAYAAEGETFHAMVYAGKDIDPSAFSEGIESLAFIAKGSDYPLVISREDFKAVLKSK